MIDVNWDLAPDGAVELKYSKSDCSASWFNNKDEHWFEDCWMNVTLPDDWQTIATRPTQKTVADAVEYYNCEFPEGQAILGIAYSNNKITPYYAGSPIAYGTNSPESYIICTRDEFEAYVKEQESKQEGEKWTHTWGEGKCRIIATDETKDEAWVKFELTGNNGIVVLSGLKPIKPTISKAEAWDLCQDYDGSQGMVKYMLELHEQYDII